MMAGILSQCTGCARTPAASLQVLGVTAAPALVAPCVGRVVAGAGVCDHDGDGLPRLADSRAAAVNLLPVPITEHSGAAHDLKALACRQGKAAGEPRR
jgi:hypothetical protein